MIIHALSAACFAFYMIEVVRWHKIRFISLFLDRKPFSCSICLSAWTGLIVSFINEGNILQSLETMFIAGVFGLILANGAQRYL